MELMIDAEMKMFKGINTPVIFLQNVVTDLLLGLGMRDVLKAFHIYVQKKYNAEAGFITMNMPRLLIMLEEAGINNPIICTSINMIGFRMAGGKELYESILQTKKVRAIHYVSSLLLLSSYKETMPIKKFQVVKMGKLFSKDAIAYPISFLLAKFPA